MIAVRSICQPAQRRCVDQTRRFFLSTIAASLWHCGPALATDDDRYPSRPIRFILPSTLGGTSDLLGRLVAQHLGEALGVPIVIDPRPGAAGRIALELAADAAPDGYTLLLANNGANAMFRECGGRKAGSWRKHSRRSPN